MTQESTAAPEQKTEQEQAALKVQESKDAEAGFAEGFKKVRGTEEQPAPSEPALETQTEAAPPAAGAAPDKGAKPQQPASAAAPAAAAAPAKDEWEGVPKVVRDRLTALDALPGQMRNLAGHIGGLNSKLDTALTAAKTAAEKAGGAAAAPTEKQVQAALSNPDAWKKLKEDYPDWAGPVEAELSAIRTELSKQPKPQQVDVAAVKKDVVDSVTPLISAAERRGREFAQVDIKHEGWEDTVKSPQFGGWLKTQPADVQGLAASDRGRDAVRLLDAYKANQAQIELAEQERLKKEKRLAGAVTPKGTNSPPQSGISDDAAFDRGFKRARGK